MGGAAIGIDELSVTRVGVDEFDSGAETFKNFFVDDTSGAIGAVETDAKASESNGAEVILKVFFVDGDGFGVKIFAVGGGNETNRFLLGDGVFDSFTTFGAKFGA